MGWEDPLEEEMATTPVFLPGKLHRQRSLADSRPWSLKRVGYDLATEHAHTVGSCITIFERDEGDYIIFIEENVFKSEKSRFKNSVDTKQQKQKVSTYNPERYFKNKTLFCHIKLASKFRAESAFSKSAVHWGSLEQEEGGT